MIMASKTARSTFLKRWLRASAIVVAMAAVCMMFGAATLKADCGVQAKHLMGSVFHPAAFVTMAAEEGHESHGHASVVGEWHVLLLINGDSATPLFQSIVQYHVGGTEMENADIPIAGGNICFGVWKQHGNKVEIYHVALLFDAGTGNPNGYAIFRQWNTLDNDGDSYHGHFTYKVYGTDNVEDTSQALSGTTEGHRIDFHHLFKLY